MTQSISLRKAFILFCFIIPTAIADSPEGAEAIDIGSRRELFVDDFLIQSFDGSARLRLHEPIAREVVMKTDRPWEGNASHYRTIFKDGERYRMYYSAIQYDVGDGEMTYPHRRLLCYAESTDGLHWERPELGLVEFAGSTENNIVADANSVAGVTIDPARLVPFKDANPACSDDAPYKAVVMVSEPRGLFALKSSDGFRFSLLHDEPIVTEGALDSQNLAFFDAHSGVYREYHRGFREGIRGILTGTSSDFIHWSEPKWVEYPEAKPEHIYTNQVQPYYRAPHILVGFPLRYVDRGWTDATEALPDLELRKARSAVSPRYGTAVTDALFMSSRDGSEFNRWRSAFIRPGIARPGSWIYGDNSIGWGMIETKSTLSGAPNELSLYVTDGYWTGDELNVRRYTLRIDGFASLHAPPEGGEIVTKPIIFAGRELMLNFATSAAGSIRIEMQDASGVPLKGFALDDCTELFGDSLEQAVHWKGSNVGSLAGRPVRMRIILNDADIYSFRFQ